MTLIHIFIDTLVYANKVKKKRYWWAQERTLAITNNALYNINNKKVQRTILIKDIGAIIKTMPPSKNTTEFTVVVPKKYDYRFISET